MRARLRKGLSLLAWGAIILGAGLFLPVAVTQAAASPKVFDGKRFVVKPTTISGFALANKQQQWVKLSITGPDGADGKPGGIEWRTWTRNRAVGIGVGRTIGCNADCGLGNPWDGTKVRVTAYRRHGDRFFRLKVVQPAAWMQDAPKQREDYRMGLVYIGNNFPGKGWRTFAFTDGWPITAKPAPPKPRFPSLFKGNGYRVKPGLMYGWDPDGFGKPLRYLGRTHFSDPRGTAIRWSTWGRKRAVGVGLARSSGCGAAGVAGQCEIGFPWNGTYLRVVAWRPRGGHFTRMKMRTLVPRTSKRYYELVLAFRGPIPNLRTVSWRTVREKRGPQPG